MYESGELAELIGSDADAPEVPVGAQADPDAAPIQIENRLD